MLFGSVMDELVGERVASGRKISTLTTVRGKRPEGNQKMAADWGGVLLAAAILVKRTVVR
jgi:hypothetical protein